MVCKITPIFGISQIGARSDPLPEIARNIAKRNNVLFFDEFQVTDVADAMMMQRLFSNLFSNNVTVISTSNREPDDLYRDGVQRDRFVPFIHLLKAVGDASNRGE